MQRNPIIVIGGGLAAGKAVQGAREQGFDGDIVLLTAESHLPYERPALSKGYLRGESSREQLAVHEDLFYADQDVEIRTGATVVSIDRSDQVVHTAAGDRVPYTRLLLAQAPSRAGSTYLVRASVGSIRCARSTTPTDCATRSTRASTSSSWVAGGSARNRGVGPSARTRRGDGSPQGVAAADSARGRSGTHLSRSPHRERGHARRRRKRRGLPRRRHSRGSRDHRGTRIAADLVVVGVGAVPRTSSPSVPGSPS